MCTRRQRGFSLVELLVSMIVIGVGLAGLMSVIPVAIRTSTDPLITKQALTIAERLGAPLGLTINAKGAVPGDHALCVPSRMMFDPLHTLFTEAMLSEISGKPFANPTNGFAGAATQANRALFDDVSDYNGYSSVGAYAIAGGAPIAGLTGYNVSVSVAGTALSGATAVDSLLITVTVTYQGGTSVSVSGYRLNYG